MIKLELTVEETNIVLASLGRMPYESVYLVVEKIKKQGESQIAEQQTDLLTPQAK